MTIARTPESGGNDLFIDPGTGSFSTVSGKEEAAQILEAAILTQKGELQLDTERGIDYFGTIFNTQHRYRLLVNDIQNRIRSFPFVRSIVSMDVRLDNKSSIFKYRAVIDTIYGRVNIGFGEDNV